ncbi:MAG: polysaccharide biosynthesis C-terminal domain-containing protein [Sphingopyxis sp.]|nr:polysaccharide biosynthesis C-terminal domain-containing protein [Sphingopyxis sp.]
MNRVILRDFIAYLPARIVPALVALAGIPIVTRLLSPADYGEYLLALTTLTLIGAFSASWIVSIVTRFRPIDVDGALAVHLRPFILSSVGGGIAAWLFIGSVYQGHGGDTWLLLAGGAWIATYTATEYRTARYRADEQAFAYSLAVCLRSIGGLLVGIALVYWAMRNGSMLLMGVAIASLFVILPIGKRKAVAARTPTDNPAFNRKDLLRYAVPIAFSNLFVVALSSVNRYIVEIYWGIEQVAIYGASYDIAERSIFFLNAMMLLSSSVMAIKVFERDGEAAAATMLGALLRFYMLIAGIIVAGAFVLADPIIWLLLPPSYQAGAIILPIVSAGAVLVGIMHRYSLILSFHKRTDIILVCTIIALIANLVASITLVSQYGIVGGAIGSLCGYLVWFIAIRWSVRKFHAPRFPWLSLLRVLLACSASGLVMYVLAGRSLAEFALAVAGGAAVYAATLFATAEISKPELAALAKFVNRS